MSVLLGSRAWAASIVARAREESPGMAVVERMQRGRIRIAEVVDFGSNARQGIENRKDSMLRQWSKRASRD